jgi:hypothetical protein
MMRNRIKNTLLLIFLLANISCEKDEICLEEITPKLILRFYDQNDPDEFKSVQNLKVNIEGIEGDYIDTSISSLTDSIAIPIKVSANMTRFILTLPGDDSQGIEENRDTLTLIYLQEDIFVSRSCGYKTVFHEGEAALTEDGDNWIKLLEQKSDPLEITDENRAHVKIYH